MRPLHNPSGRLRLGDTAPRTFRRAIQRLAARTLTSVYRRMLFLTYQLAGNDIPVYRSRAGLEFATLGADDLAAYYRFRPGSSRHNIERRLARGDRCFVSWHEGEIVDACWTATGCIYVPYLQRYLIVPPGDIYSFDSFTARGARGLGIYMARNSFTARQNQAEGFRRSIALVAAENYAAWLILTRSGLRTIGAYHYVRLPGRGLLWQTTEPGDSLPELQARCAEVEPLSLVPARLQTVD